MNNGQPRSLRWRWPWVLFVLTALPAAAFAFTWRPAIPLSGQIQRADPSWVEHGAPGRYRARPSSHRRSDAGPTSAAIANAFADATGVRLRDLPLSRARVRAAVARA